MEQLNPHQNAYDSSVAKRVAGVILRHVQPISRAEAFQLLSARLSIQLINQADRAMAVDLYFDDQAYRIAA